MWLLGINKATPLCIPRGTAKQQVRLQQDCVEYTVYKYSLPTWRRTEAKYLAPQNNFSVIYHSPQVVSWSENVLLLATNNMLENKEQWTVWLVIGQTILVLGVVPAIEIPRYRSVLVRPSADGCLSNLAFGLAAISVWGCERATVGLADGRTQSAATETGHCRRGRKPFHCEATAHGPWVALRPNLKKEPINKNKRICKLSCAPQLQVWYAVEKMYFRLQFQCGEHLLSGEVASWFS